MEEAGSSAEQRAARYIAGLRYALRTVKLREGAKPSYERLLDAVKRYLDDAEYYLGRGDAETALVAASYAEGLLDSLRYLGLAEPEWRSPPRRRVALVAGTFDILHPGHIYFLREASRHGDLYVIVARDKNVERNKGRRPIFPEECRAEMVSAIRYVRKAVLGDEEDYLKRVVEIRPDVVILGPDQPFSPQELREALRRRGLRDVEVVRLPERLRGGCPTSTTEIIKTVLRRFCGCIERT